MNIQKIGRIQIKNRRVFLKLHVTSMEQNLPDIGWLPNLGVKNLGLNQFMLFTTDPISNFEF